jgi:hypothetical protein
MQIFKLQNSRDKLSRGCGTTRMLKKTQVKEGHEIGKKFITKKMLIINLISFFIFPY